MHHDILTRWLLILPQRTAYRRYRDYRRRRVGFQRDAWLFLDDPGLILFRWSTPRWQRIRAEHKKTHPHINARVRVR